MGAVQKSLRLSEETVREIDKLAKERGEDFSATAKNSEEANDNKMPRIILPSRLCALMPHSHMYRGMGGSRLSQARNEIGNGSRKPSIG